MGAREDRFERLFAAAYPDVWRYARRRVPEADVDDVVAETFTVAWRRLDEVPEDRALPWLYRVAANTIANRLRSQRRHLRLVSRLQAEPPPAPAAEGDPEILDALAALRPDDQEVLRLAAWEGLGPAEIAVVLGCSDNAAAVRLSRARARLRERLTGSDRTRTQARRKEIDV